MLSDFETSLLSTVDKLELTNLLADLVRCPSITGDEKEVVERLAAYLDAKGLAVAIDDAAPGRPNLSCEWGSGEPPILLLTGHTDTVPIGEGWSKDPFGAEIDNGRLFGRGSCDMKAGLAGMAMTMAIVRKALPRFKGTVRFAACVDEEVSGIGTQAAIRNGLAADWAIIGEPTELQVIRACKGNCYFEVEVTGKAAHAGSPELGVNAIYGAADAVHVARDHADSLSGHRHALLGSPSLSVGTIKGGFTVSAVPDKCEFWVDRRLLPGETGAEALAAFKHALNRGLTLPPDMHCNAALRMELPPSEIGEDHPLVAATLAAALDAGAPPRPVGGWSAASDGGYLMRDAAIPVVLFGPGSITRQAHRPDEYVSLAETVLAARVYLTAAIRALNGARTADLLAVES